MKGYIYRYTFIDNKVYIGQTRRNPEIRHREHLNEKVGAMNTGFWEAYKHLGEPKYEIIEVLECETTKELIEQLNDRETYWIQLYKADNPEYGYNRKSKGTATASRHDIYDDIFNKVFNEIYKRKFEIYAPILEKKLAGIPLSLEDKKVFDYYWKDNNPFYKTDEDIEDEIIRDFSWHIMYSDAFDEADEYIEANKSYLLMEYWLEKVILQLDDDNNICNVFTSLNEIAQCLNLKRTENIRHVLNGVQKSAYGYKWCLAKDYKGDKNKILNYIKEF